MIENFYESMGQFRERFSARGELGTVRSKGLRRSAAE